MKRFGMSMNRLDAGSDGMGSDHIVYRRIGCTFAQFLWSFLSISRNYKYAHSINTHKLTVITTIAERTKNASIKHLFPIYWAPTLDNCVC
jgi:hypothetical protein